MPAILDSRPQWTAREQLGRVPMVATLDLYVQEPVLGADSRFVREAGVSFGRPTIVPVGDNELPALTRRRPDYRAIRFTTLIWPFDLEDLDSGQRYVEATVRLTFDDPAVRSVSLGLPPLPDPVPDCLLTTWGIGQPQLAWKLAASDRRAGIRPSGRGVLAIVESPLASGQLAGTIDACAGLMRRVLGVDRAAAAEPKHPLRFRLGVPDGSFELQPAGS